jgi:peroxiredoxin
MKQYFTAALLLCISAYSAIAQTKPATGFALKSTEGKMLSLADFAQQKGIILTFVTNTCPVALAYQQRIEALQKKYAPRGFAVIAIDPSDNFAEMKKEAALKKYSYTFLYDSAQAIAKSYKVKANTHTVILQNTAAGFVVVYEGAIDNDYTGERITKKYVENSIEAMLANKHVPLAKTRVLGCPVSYRE